jgi:hypothetical protein
MSGEATAEATVEPETRRRRDEADLLGEGRLRSVVVDGRTVAVSTCPGRFGALDTVLPVWQTTRVDRDWAGFARPREADVGPPHLTMESRHRSKLPRT